MISVEVFFLSIRLLEEKMLQHHNNHSAVLRQLLILSSVRWRDFTVIPDFGDQCCHWFRIFFCATFFSPIFHDERQNQLHRQRSIGIQQQHRIDRLPTCNSLPKTTLLLYRAMGNCGLTVLRGLAEESGVRSRSLEGPSEAFRQGKGPATTYSTAIRAYSRLRPVLSIPIALRRIQKSHL